MVLNEKMVNNTFDVVQIKIDVLLYRHKEILNFSEQMRKKSVNVKCVKLLKLGDTQ